MDFISILATVILFTTIATLAVGVAVYAAYKLRERRRPDKRAKPLPAGEIELIFLEPYAPEPSPDEALTANAKR